LSEATAIGTGEFVLGIAASQAKQRARPRKIREGYLIKCAQKSVIALIAGESAGESVFKDLRVGIKQKVIIAVWLGPCGCIGTLPRGPTS